MELKSVNAPNKEHNIVLNERKLIELTGIKTVISFDTEEVLLDTSLGGLLIKGHELHINQLNLDKGFVDVEGKVDSLIYSDKSALDNTAKGIIARLCR